MIGSQPNLQEIGDRAMHDAIMIGVGTAVADDPLLTVRFPGGGAKAMPEFRLFTKYTKL